MAADFALGPPAVLAAKAAITSIPIVFVAVADPLRFGFVASFNRRHLDCLHSIGAKATGARSEMAITKAVFMWVTFLRALSPLICWLSR